MFQTISIGNSMPYSWICDPSDTFEAGMVAQLKVSGSQIVCGVSDGRAPIGIIDDVRSTSFTAAAWAETLIVPATGVISGGQYITPVDIKWELKNPNVLPSSFASSIDVSLNARNGVVTFLAGTVLNLDFAGTGYPNAIRAIVNYRYQIPNVIGDDSIQGNRITVWFQRMIAQTDVFETNQIYPLNANLFVSEAGLLTTRQPTERHPVVAIVTAPPSGLLSSLNFLWL